MIKIEKRVNETESATQFRPTLEIEPAPSRALVYNSRAVGVQFQISNQSSYLQTNELTFD